MIPFQDFRLDIPNREVRYSYLNIIKAWLEEDLESSESFQDFIRGVREEDSRLIERGLRSILFGLASYYDGTPAGRSDEWGADGRLLPRPGYGDAGLPWLGLHCGGATGNAAWDAPTLCLSSAGTQTDEPTQGFAFRVQTGSSQWLNALEGTGAEGLFSGETEIPEGREGEVGAGESSHLGSGISGEGTRYEG